MATMRNIAERAGVSIATVSAVINSSAYVRPELKNRVMKACKALNYYPNEIARSLKNKKTKAIGVIIPDISNPFFTSLVRGIEDFATKNGFIVILCNTDENGDKEDIYLRILRSRNIDGIIMATANLSRKYTKNPLIESVPLVFVNRFPSEPNVDVVTVDNFKVGNDAVNYLLKLGHRRIGIIIGPQNVSTTEERLRGCKEALKKANIRISKTLLKEGNAILTGGYAKGMELLSLRTRPSAIFATNNLMTVGVMKAIREKGILCPEDISLIGVDSFDWADLFNPRLTTVMQPTYEMGWKAAELLIRKIESENKEPQRIILEHKLMIRESCKYV